MLINHYLIQTFKYAVTRHDIVVKNDDKFIRS